MDLLPSHEELDNTGFRVADKKSMLALIGERRFRKQRRDINVDPLDFNPKNTSSSISGSHSTDRSSPPPGYIPDALQQVARNGSFTSINSEGEFIPESMDQVPPHRTSQNRTEPQCLSDITAAKTLKSLIIFD